MSVAPSLAPTPAVPADAELPARVLVVEDERIVAMNLQAKLEGMGYRVAALVHSGEAAVAAAEELRPDLVLMDIRLDGRMDGVEAAGLIRDRLGVPVVYLTAYSTRDIVRRAKVTEPYGYILKPVSDRELHVVVEVALYRHRMERQLVEQKRLLAATLASIGDGVVATDLDGRVTFLNPVAEALTGWELRDARGHPVEDVMAVVGARTGQPVELPVRRAIRERAVRPLAGDVFLRGRTGKVVPIADSAAPILGDGDTVLGGVLVFQDVTDRVRAENALRASEERYRTLVDHATDAIFLHATDCRVLDANRQACLDLGYDLAELVGLYPDRFDPDITPAALARIVAELDAGRSVAFDSRHRRKDGTTFPVEVRLRPFIVGGVRYHIGITRDITDRKRADEALRASEERLRLALAAGRMGTYDWDIISGRLVWSDGHYEMFGYPPGDHFPVEFRHFLDRVNPDDRPAVERDLRAAMDGRTGYRNESRIVLPDGTVRWILDTGEFTYGVDGTPVRMLGVVADITDRKRAEDALRASEERLRLALTAGRMGTYDWDVATGAVVWSDGHYGLFGYPPGDRFAVEFRHFIDRVHPDDRAGVERDIRAAMDGRSEYRNESRIVLPDGTVRWILGTGEFAVSADGKPVRMLGVVADVTERRRLEDQFRQAQKMEAVGLLASGVAHDFNNLLTVIGGYSSLMLESLPADDRNREAVAEIREAGERAANLTRHLLAFSRQQQLDPVVLNVNDVVVHAGRLLDRLLGEDIDIALDLDPAPDRVRADAGQLEQALLNLAVNARDAMPGGGRLTVATRTVTADGTNGAPAGKYVRLTVTDTGHGMSEEVRARVFEPFFTTKPADQGTGLGLPMVYGFVAQSGGHIGVTSAVGVGTTFALHFPAVAAETTEPVSVPMPAVPRANDGETVLLVEDDPSVRQFAAIALQMQGYAVLEAEGGPEAIRVADAHPGPIQLLVTDVVMPEMGGRQLTDALRGRRPGLRVLFVSGYLEDAVRRHGVADGTDHFLHKPFTPIAIARTVRAVLDGPT